MRSRSFPIGLDIGSSRVRACAIGWADGRFRVLRVAACDIAGDDVAAAIRRTHAELGSTERRCVVAVRPPDAVVRRASFPRMSAAERRRAAAFASRGEGAATVPVVTRVRALPAAGDYACGTIVRSVLAERVAVCRRAGLRAVAVEYEPLAWRRVSPSSDCVLDVGLRSSRLIAFGRDVPHVTEIPLGGTAFTEAVGASLGLDFARAEDRKRASGLGPSGDAERERLVSAVFDVVTTLRARGVADVRTLVLGGNGSRIAALAEALSTALGCEVARVDPQLAIDTAYPADVFRAATPDWSVAVGLALAGCAA
jgi:Tfp pilus assembly PilM family ATPase